MSAAARFRRALFAASAATLVLHPAWGLAAGESSLQLSRVDPAPPTSSKPAILREIGIDQRLGAQTPLDAVFLDEAGRPVRLGELLSGRPVILSLAYYRCPMLCTQVLEGLASCLSVLSFDIGREFDVLTVSFDPRDTPPLAEAKKKAVVDRYRRPGAARAGWRFLTGQRESIDRLAQAVGFRYVFDPGSDRYAHAAGIVVLTPDGKVSRYFYGIEYSPRDLRLGLVEASAGKIGSPVDQVLLYCFHYDPATGTYAWFALNLVRAGGVVTVLALAAFLVFSLRGERGRRASPRAQEGALAVPQPPDR